MPFFEEIQTPTYKCLIFTLRVSPYATFVTPYLFTKAFAVAE